MAEPEAVVEDIREAGAAEVAAVAAVGDSVIASEVAAVADELADHAEVSEERHEEILEGQQWAGLKVEDVLQRLDNLSTSMGTLQATVLSNQQTATANLQLLQATLESRLPLPGSSPSIPPASSQTVIAVVEPEAASEEESPPQRQPPKRKRRII